MDETETTAQTKPSNVVAERGKKQVGANNSSKCGVLSAVVICMSAGGNFIPPFIIVPGENEGRNDICCANRNTVFVQLIRVDETRAMQPLV